MSEFRLRIGFAKRGRAAYLSHLETLHAVERIVRRAQLPYAITQGFHPHMKLAFGPALSVGVASEREYADLHLTQFVAPEEALKRLQEASPEALRVEAVGYVHPKEASLTASLTILSYCAELTALSIDAHEVKQRFAEIATSDALEVEHKGKMKVFNPSQCIVNDAIVEERGDSTTICFTLRVTPSGTLRPDVLLERILSPINATYARLTLTRTGLFSETEEGLVPPL